MKSLVIAEKPSLAKNVIQAIETREKFAKKNGYYESNNYIVSWAVGHLLQLKDIADYEGEKKKWKDISLPFIPEKFEFKVKDNVKEQFKILKQLINRNDVGELFNCGDPDREGEVIVRLILNEVKNDKPVYRLWLPDQEIKTVLKSLDKKESDKNYDNLYNEGLARTFLDWILGINETIYLTNKKGTLLRAGRILVPIVKKIYDRDMEIKKFIPVTYYQPESDVDNIKLIFKDKFANKSDAEKKADELNLNPTIVDSITTKDVKKQPSNLFSLTSLQKYMNKKYKMSASKVLELVQKLYENKYTTYPRTDSEYMTIDEKDKAQEIITALNDCNLEFKDKKGVFQNTGEPHSAITPTTTIPELLSSDEKLVYDTICNRFKANFCKEDCIISETDMIIRNGEHEFKLKGKSVKQQGFFMYEPFNNEKMLPNLSEKQELKTKFEAAEKQTQPPQKLTEATLISYLEQPFKKDLEDDDEEENEKIDKKEIGLGTPATRAGIINNAKKMEYIIEEKNVLSIGDIGITLIETIEQLGINLYAEKTIQFSKDLKSVNEGSLTLEQCIKNVTNEIEEIISNGNKIIIEKINKPILEKEVIGKCPKCGKNIFEGEKSYYCEGYKECNFSIWKDNKFFKARGKKLTKSIVKNILKDGKAKVKGFKKKDSDKTYDANIILDLSNEKFVNFTMSF